MMNTDKHASKAKHSLRARLAGLFGSRKMRSQTRSDQRRPRAGEAGNVFFTLFGAVAVVGVLGAGIMSTMRGPLTTMVEVNRIEETKAVLRLNSRLVLRNATNGDSADASPPTTRPASEYCDDDAFTEAPFPDTWAGSPTGGGALPNNVGATLTDPWGTQYGYCAWNHGSDTSTCTNTLAGNNGSTDVVIALISAGPDRTFNTTCADLFSGDGNGDDIAQRIPYADAATIAGGGLTDGLWTIVDDGSGTNDVANIGEELQVTATGNSSFAGGATFGGNVSVDPGMSVSAPSVSTDIIVPFGAGTTVSVNANTLDVNANGDISGTLTVGGNLTVSGTSTTTLGGTLDVTGDTTLAVLNATGAVDFDSTLNVGGSITDIGDNIVTIDDDLDVTGAGNITGNFSVNTNMFTVDGTTGNTVVAGTTQMNGNVTITGDGNANTDVLLEVLNDDGAGGTATTFEVLGDGETRLTATTSDGTTDAFTIDDALGAEIFAVDSNGTLSLAGGIADGTSGNILISNGTSFQSTPVAGTTDVTISTGGDLQIVAGAVDTNELADGAVTLNKIESISGDVLLGYLGVSGPPEVITLGAGLSITGTTLNVDTSSGGGDGVGSDGFTDLADTPGDYTGTTAGDLVVVNATTNGLEFVDAATIIPANDRIEDAPDATAANIVDTYIDVDTTDNGQTNSIVFVNDGNESLRILDSGNVGIGNISAPAADLVLYENSGYATMNFQNGTSGITATDGFSLSYGGNEMSFWMYENEPMRFATNGATRMFIEADGDIAIGAAAPNASAILDIQSTTRGMLAPRVTTTQRNAIATPATGLLVFTTDAGDAGIFQFWDGTAWVDVGGGGAETGGLWEPDGTNDYIEYDDTLGGVRIGRVTGQPAPATDWLLDVTNSVVYTTTNKVGINSSTISTGLELDVTGNIGATNYCNQDGGECFDAGDIAALAGGGGNLWTDNTTHITREGMHIIDIGQTLTSSGLTGAASKAFWYPDRGVFRAGTIDGSGTLSGAEWNEGNVGDASVAMGYNAAASGYASVALGYGNIASNQAAVALGHLSIASNINTVAIGNNTVASGTESHAFGGYVTASGANSIIFGSGNGQAGTVEVSGSESMAFILDNLGSATNITASNSMVILGGNVGIGNPNPTTRLDVTGTIKIGNGTETCLVADHEGAIRYLAGSDTYEVCANSATGWEPLFTGGSGAAGVWTDLGGGRIHYGDDGTQQVGVGTNNPITTLDVNGGVRVGSISGNAPSYLSLNSLTDVDASAPANGQVLTYNTSSGNWEAYSIATAVGAAVLNDLSDVNAISPLDNQCLIYDLASSRWEAGDCSSGGPGAIALNDLTDVTTTGATQGQVIKFDGTNWVLGDDLGGDLLFSGNLQFTANSYGNWGTEGNAGINAEVGYYNSITLLTPTRAVVQTRPATNPVLRVYDFDGTDWNQVGSTYTTPLSDGAFERSITAINSTDIAMEYQGQIRTLRFDGTNWSFIGTGNALANYATQLDAMTSTTVVGLSRENELEVFLWNGTTWTRQGGAFDVNPALPDDDSTKVTALDNNTIAIMDTVNDLLLTYDWNGSTWTQIGSTFNSPVNMESGSTITALSDSMVAVKFPATGTLRTYIWDGSNWTLESSDLNSLSNNTYNGMSAIDTTTIVISAQGGGFQQYTRTSGTSSIADSDAGGTLGGLFSAGNRIRVTGSSTNDGIYSITGVPNSNTLQISETLFAAGPEAAQISLIDSASTLNSLVDVSASAPSNGDVLVYNNSTGMWEAESSAPSADTLSSLSCNANEIARWNGTQWVCSAETNVDATLNLQFTSIGVSGGAWAATGPSSALGYDTASWRTAITLLNSTTMAVAYNEGGNTFLTTFELSGGTWTEIPGAVLDLGASQISLNMDRISNNSVVLSTGNGASGNAVAYAWNGATWSVANASSVGGYGVAAAMTNTLIAYYNNFGGVLHALSWNGSTLTDLGSTNIGAGDSYNIDQLDNNTIVLLTEGTPDRLHVYRWTGAAWTQLGSSYDLPIEAGGYGRTFIANASNIVTIGESGNLYTFSWDGTTWTPAGTTNAIGDGADGKMVMLDSNSAWHLGNGDVIRQYDFSATIANSTIADSNTTGQLDTMLNIGDRFLVSRTNSNNRVFTVTNIPNADTINVAENALDEGPIDADITVLTDLPSAIEDLSDVQISSVSDGQCLVYNNVDGYWEAGDCDAAGNTAEWTDDGSGNIFNSDAGNVMIGSSTSDTITAECVPTINNVQNNVLAVAPDDNITIPNYAVPTVTNGILFVSIGVENDINTSNVTVSGVTFGGNAMTEVDQASYVDKTAALYYYLGPSGTGDIVITASEDVEIIHGIAYTVSCLEQQAPEALNIQSAGTSSTGLTTSVTTTTDNAFIVDAFFSGNDELPSVGTVAQNTIARIFTNNGSITGSTGASFRRAGLAASYNMAWSSSNNSEGHVVAAFEVSPGTALGTLRLDVSGYVGADAYCNADGSQCLGIADIVSGSVGGGGEWTDDGSGNIYNTDTGNVGIGTTNPTNRLEILGGSIVLREDDDGNAAIEMSSDNTDGWIELKNNNSNTVFISSKASTPTFFNSGDVGIGVTTPANELEVVGDIRSDSIILNAVPGAAPNYIGQALGSLSDVALTTPATNDVLSWNGSAWVNSSGGGGLWTENGSDIYFDTGNVGIGTTTPNLLGAARELVLSSGTTTGTAATMSIQGNMTSDGTAGALAFFNAANNIGYIEGVRSGANNTGSINIYTSNAGTLNRRMRIHSNGGIAIGNHTPAAELDVAGDIIYTGTITDTSDIRLKTDISPLNQSDMISRIAAVDTYSFRMKDDVKGRTEYGVMAQELEKIFPELVHTASDEMGTKSVNYVGLIAPMIEATKSLKAENDALKAEIAEIKSAQADILEEVKGLSRHTGYGMEKADMMSMFAAMILMLLSGMGIMFVYRQKGLNTK